MKSCLGCVFVVNLMENAGRIIMFRTLVIPRHYSKFLHRIKIFYFVTKNKLKSYLEIHEKRFLFYKLRFKGKS